MAGGYAGKILNVDLSTGRIGEEIPPEGLLRDFLGGYGVGARLRYYIPDGRHSGPPHPGGEQSVPFGLDLGPRPDKYQYAGKGRFTPGRTT